MWGWGWDLDPRLPGRYHHARHADGFSLRDSRRKRQQPDHSGLRGFRQHEPSGRRLAAGYRSPDGGGVSAEGIYLRNVRDSVVENNLANNNFNGISLVQCDRNVIRGNNASYCGNVGIYLLASCDNEVSDNRAEHCIRYTDRFWCDTADSAGMLLEHGSNRNRIIGNSLRYSGDGFFIRAHNREPSNGNLVSGNDGSYSPNNAFEAVFSAGNVFEGNIANYSNYGFWLGYSTDITVRRNEIRANRFDGIAIEHGRDNRIEDNHVAGNRNGIRLWSDPTTGESPRRAYVISGNSVERCQESGISITNDHYVELSDNQFGGNGQDYVRQTI